MLKNNRNHKSEEQVKENKDNAMLWKSEAWGEAL